MKGQMRAPAKGLETLFGATGYDRLAHVSRDFCRMVSVVIWDSRFLRLY